MTSSAADAGTALFRLRILLIRLDEGSRLDLTACYGDIGSTGTGIRFFSILLFAPANASTVIATGSY